MTSQSVKWRSRRISFARPAARLVILGEKIDSVEYGALHVEALFIKTSAQSASKQTLDAVTGKSPKLGVGELRVRS